MSVSIAPIFFQLGDFRKEFILLGGKWCGFGKRPAIAGGVGWQASPLFFGRFTWAMFGLDTLGGFSPIFKDVSQVELGVITQGD